MVAAFATTSSGLTVLFLFLAAWTDERALIAVPFLMLYRRRVYPALSSLAVYVAVRLCFVAICSYPAGATGVGLAVLRSQVQIAPLAVWSGLGASWMVVVFAIAALIRRERMASALCFSTMVGVSMLAGMAVVDVTRGMAYCLPAVFVALAILSKCERVRRVEHLTATGALVSLLVPTFYLEGVTGLWSLTPLPLQLIRWFT
jgi:hypothetical protein